MTSSARERVTRTKLTQYFLNAVSKPIARNGFGNIDFVSQRGK